MVHVAVHPLYPAGDAFHVFKQNAVVVFQAIHGHSGQLFEILQLSVVAVELLVPKMYSILLDVGRVEVKTRVIDIIWKKQQEDKDGFVVALMLIHFVTWILLQSFELARCFNFNKKLSCRRNKSKASRHLFGVKGNSVHTMSRQLDNNKVKKCKFEPSQKKKSFLTVFRSSVYELRMLISHSWYYISC